MRPLTTYHLPLTTYHLLPIICLFGTLNLTGQGTTSFFEIVPLSGITLDTGASNYLDSILAIVDVDDYKIVKDNPLKNHYTNNEFVINNPFTENVDTLFPIDIYYSSADDYYWAGEYLDSDDGLYIRRTPEGLSGRIFQDSSYIALMPLDSVHSLAITFGDSSNHIGCGNDTSTQVGSTTHNCVNETGCAAMIKLLIVVPPDVNDWISGRESTVSERNKPFLSTIVDFTNFVFARSNIGHRIYAETVEFDYPFPTTSMENWIKEDAQNRLPFNQDIINLRDNKGADIVLLLSNHNYRIGQGPVGGYAAAFGPDYSKAMAIQ